MLTATASTFKLEHIADARKTRSQPSPYAVCFADQAQFGAGRFSRCYSRVSTFHDSTREETLGGVEKEYDGARIAYRQFSDADIPRRHIYEEVFFSEQRTPYAVIGLGELQRARLRVEAHIGFLESKTSPRKPKTAGWFKKRFSVGQVARRIPSINPIVREGRPVSKIGKVGSEYAVTERRHRANRLGPY